MSILGNVLGAATGGLFSIAGGLLGSSSAKKQQEANYKAQKEFAQNSIRWKVDDAKAAGIHPLFALGGNTASYSPNPVVAGDYGLSEVGQNLGRAVQAGMTKEGRTANNWAESLTRERMLIDNELARTQLAAAKQALTNPAGQPPPLPSAIGPDVPSLPGQSHYKIKADEAPSASPTAPHAAAAPQPLYRFARNGDGGWIAIVNQDVLESDSLQGAGLLAEGIVNPPRPPNEFLPKGAVDWDYSYWKGAWYPKYAKTAPRRVGGGQMNRRN